MRSRRAYTGALILALIILFTVPAYGQEDSGRGNAPLFRERILFGGSFGLQFGTYTYIEASPVIGLWLLPRLNVAVGPVYKYLKDPFGSTGVYGGKAFTRLILIKDINNIIPIGFGLSIYLHGEYEHLSFRADFFNTNTDRARITNSAVLGGFGFAQHLGPRSSLNISILWVMSESMLDIYDNPEVKIGVTF